MTQEDLAGLKIDKSTFSSPKAGRRRHRRYIILVLIVLIAGGGLWRALSARAIQVQTATVSKVFPSQTFTVLNASGYVVAQRKAAVASKATGRLEWLGVEEGSRVREGQVLARLENRDVLATRAQASAAVNSARASLEQASAELKDASLNHDRMKVLLSQGIVAQADYDVALARYKRAVAGVSGAEAAIKTAQASFRGADVAVEYTLIRAPFDAVVLTKNADVGDIVTPLGAAANAKAAVVTIADPDSIQVEADVSEANLEKVKVGQPCEIQLDALPDNRFRGVVHMIVPTADRSKATVLVKVRFAERDRRVLPEMSAKVAFLERPVTPAEAKPRVAVNPAAVARRGEKPVLFVVKDGRVTERVVTLGEKVGDLVEVRAGVTAGEKIAVSPLDKLKDGTRIVTAEK